jgi:hypothetical protein
MRLVLTCSSTIEKSPLQIYSGALAFCPENSEFKRKFSGTLRLSPVYYLFLAGVSFLDLYYTPRHFWFPSDNNVEAWIMITTIFLGIIGSTGFVLDVTRIYVLNRSARLQRQIREVAVMTREITRLGDQRRGYRLNQRDDDIAVKCRDSSSLGCRLRGL